MATGNWEYLKRLEKKRSTSEQKIKINALNRLARLRVKKKAK